MTDFKLSQEMKINGITPVDNLFISEFMLTAPGDFVKVYIYTLMQCHIGISASLETIAHDLAMDTEKVESAFNYWVRKGLLKQHGACLTFESPMTVVSCNAVAAGNSLNQYSQFNASLLEIMAGRNITSSDFEIAYSWIEIFGMSEACVLEMVSYAINSKYKAGIRVSFNTLNKLAVSWSDMGITTEEKAQKYIKEQVMVTSDAKEILSHLGQFRNPTFDEFRLLDKWEKAYGFDLEAILSCCSEMVYSKNPSFALLNSIIEKYHASGISTLADIEKARAQSDEMFDLYKEIVQRSGGFGNATKAQKEMIDKLIADGFNKQALIYVCDYLVAMDKKGLASAVRLAKELRDKGIIEENAVCEELENRRILDEKVREFLSLAGLSRNPTPKDLEMYSLYFNAFGSYEIMEQAARFASKAKNKNQHLALLLNEWKSRGVTTLEAATDIAPEPVKKQDSRREYMQSGKSYSKKDLFDVFE